MATTRPEPEEEEEEGKPLRGPKPKGKRKQFTVSFPVEDFALYEAKARERGIPIGDYIAATCAVAHDRDEPEYIRRGWPYKQEPDRQPDLLSA